MESESAGRAPVVERPKGRRRWLRRVAIALVLVLVLAAALVALAPALIGGAVAGYAERDFAFRYRGRLELPSLSLAWRERQTVEGARLLDPEGGEVARASVELPSLLELVDAARAYDDEGERIELGRVVVEFEAEVVAGEDGTTNLERALAPRETAAGPEPPPAEPGPPAEPRPPAEEQPGEDEAEEDGELLALYERLGLELVLRPSSVRYRDARAGTALPPLALTGLEGALELRPGEPLRLALDGRHELGQPGPLSLEVTASQPSAAGGTLDFGTVQVALDVRDLPHAFLAEQLGDPTLAEKLTQLLGTSLALRAGVEGAGALERKTLSLGLEAGDVRVDARGRVVEGRLESPPDAPLMDLAVALPAGLLPGLVAPYLPEGAALDSTEDGARLELSVPELSVPMDPATALAGARARVMLALGPIVYTDPALAAQGERLELRRLELAARTAPGEGARLELTGALDEAGRERLAARVDLPVGWAEVPREELAVDLAVTAAAFPTRLLDALAGQEGLLVDVLGPELAMELSAAALSASGGRLDARLDSSLGSLAWKATYADGALRATRPGDRLAVSARLGPILSKRVIGPLLPTLVDLQKPEGAAPLELAVRDFVLPLDGALDAIAAEVELALGTVSYRLLPELATQLPAADLLTRRTVDLPAYVVQIGGGVARYDDLPLTIDGERFDWEGTFDLEQKRFDLAVALPLGKLRGEVGEALEPLRKVLPADLAVPLHLGGTITKPKLSLGEGFLEGAARDAAKQGLEKELEKVIDKELGGDLQKKLRELLGRDG